MLRIVSDTRKNITILSPLICMLSTISICNPDIMRPHYGEFGAITCMHKSVIDSCDFANIIINIIFSCLGVRRRWWI